MNKKYVILKETHEDAGHISKVHRERKYDYLIDHYLYEDQMWIDKEDCEIVNKNITDRLKNKLTRNEWLIIYFFIMSDCGKSETTKLSESMIETAKSRGWIKSIKKLKNNLTKNV